MYQRSPLLLANLSTHYGVVLKTVTILLYVVFVVPCILIHTMSPKSGPPTDGDIATTLSNLTDFQNSMIVGKSGELNCKQNTYNIYHQTQHMLPHCMWKIKVQICDKLCTKSTFSA